MRLGSIAVICLLLTGCHEGEERDALEKAVRHADVVLAERQEVAQNLNERRQEADVLLRYYARECPPDSDDAVIKRLKSAAPSVRAKLGANGAFWLNGDDAPQAARPILDRLAKEVPFLTLVQLDGHESAWTAVVRVTARCRPTPQPDYTVLEVPPKTDVLRPGLEDLRAHLAREQRMIHELEKVIGPHSTVLVLNALKKEVEAALDRDASPRSLKAQLALLDPLLASPSTHRLAVRVQPARIDVASDAPLTATGDWQVQGTSGCGEKWCAEASPIAHAR